MTTRDQQRRAKRTWKDRILTAFKARDEEALAEAMEMAKDEITNGVEGGEGTEEISGPGEHRIVIEVKSAADPTAATESQEEQGEGSTVTDEENSEAPAWFKSFADNIEARLSKLEGGSTSDEASDEDDDDTTQDAEGEEGEDDDGETKDEASEEAEDKDAEGKTKDSASLRAEFTDTLARAEILAPGIKLPTFDAKATRKVTRDRLCAFRRRALVRAVENAETRDTLKGIVGPRFDASKLTCDAAGVMFTAASELVKSANTTITTTGHVHDHGTTAGPANISDINEKNRNFWREKGGAL